ncbi:MAG: YbgC/FadM family acyl-CoA thioesterase [Rhodospirillales bacterium]|jgi:acyl-CoA thioester hydrolase|nr:hypothetical protein [Rhodospirillaceae bacterium]MDP6429947.1 YbgC/FadM family acyl-CoA thioesterase [Rhodospirillales bacterium]MDP6646770.1 YbgC/FadM family acyl-CoA thioesterase [Rhodospirillales bacterium]|tara:strand:- start:288 stop:737 length:450 start_codon:yes stop_codon:yes gene_type:complete
MNKINRDQVGAAQHVHPLRVYWEDTDAAGIVYYANYLKFAERARSEILYQAGIDQVAMQEQDGVVFAVRSCNTDYLKPARLGEQLQVHTSLLGLKGASFELRQTVKRQTVKGETEDLVVMDVRIACVTIDGKPARLPGEVKAVLSRGAV